MEFIKGKIDQFAMKGVFNMDETTSFYMLKVDHSLATKQLEGKKKHKEMITVVICYTKYSSEKFLYESLESMQNHVASRM